MRREREREGLDYNGVSYNVSEVREIELRLIKAETVKEVKVTVKLRRND